MQLDIKPGFYVVAVSGGVDSMVLLDLLAKMPGSRLVVAHFEHGIRSDSMEDFNLVKAAAKKYGLPFAASHGNLGPRASEARARTARYDFLHHVLAEEKADAIITAHHQDDMLETAIINLLRGTGRLGLSALGSKGNLLRPLLNYTKDDIIKYATAHNLKWREDTTNADDRYLRNYIRHNILTRMGQKGRQVLLGRVRQARSVNSQIDDLLSKDLDLQPAINQLKRNWFVQLPYAVATEVMATWLRRNGLGHFDRGMVERLVVTAKTKPAGKEADVDAGHKMVVEKGSIKLAKRPDIK